MKHRFFGYHLGLFNFTRRRYGSADQLQHHAELTLDQSEQAPLTTLRYARQVASLRLR